MCALLTTAWQLSLPLCVVQQLNTQLNTWGLGKSPFYSKLVILHGCIVDKQRRADPLPRLMTVTAVTVVVGDGDADDSVSGSFKLLSGAGVVFHLPICRALWSDYLLTALSWYTHLRVCLIRPPLGSCESSLSVRLIQTHLRRLILSCSIQL